MRPRVRSIQTREEECFTCLFCKLGAATRWRCTYVCDAEHAARKRDDEKSGLHDENLRWTNNLGGL